MQIEIIKLQIGTHAQLNFSTFETDASPASVPCVDDGWLLHNLGQAHNSRHLPLLFALLVGDATHLFSRWAAHYSHCSFLSNRNDWFLLSAITLIALKKLYTLDILLFIY